MRYHFKIESKGKCVICIQTDKPQFRTILVHRDGPNFLKIPFPYIIFTIVYKKVNGKFRYMGYRHSGEAGLYVSLSNKRLKNIDDIVMPSPTEYLNSGGVCTAHKYDGKVFSTLKELCNFVIDHWWGLTHTSFAFNYWKNLTLDDLDEIFEGELTERSWPKHKYSSLISKFVKIPKKLRLNNKKW